MYLKLYYLIECLKYFGFDVLGELTDFADKLQHFAELQFQSLRKQKQKHIFYKTELVNLLVLRFTEGRHCSKW